jgi:stage V sporulation protein SpoVS
MELWVGCIAGALQETEYREKLANVGFEAIDLEVTRMYSIEEARSFLTAKGIDVDAVAAQVDGKIVSAFIRAKKPAEVCCGGNCACNA